MITVATICLMLCLLRITCVKQRHCMDDHRGR
jgi:hypothetical protein